jgi:uncharacterized lipoprotein YddW (UPF0748 family)
VIICKRENSKLQGESLRLMLHLEKGVSTVLLSVWLAGISAPAATYTYEPASVSVPRPQREFRGAWIATVANIDWPSIPTLTTAQQKTELIALLDRAAQLKLNVIIFQVRPACDALYASELEPWSEFLTGAMGKRPEPLYDPLSFAVEEAHRRGLELHAWFNPFRAGHPSAKSALADNHVSRLHPQWVRHYGKQVWLDPGEKEARDYSLRVVMDVVRRYDIDGVHFDDYFYPYKELNRAGEEMEFPDEGSWKKSGAGRSISRDDWRRENVDQFIQSVYTSVKAAKPWVKFGVSPFGIWRPGNPPSIKGFDAYEKLYADSRKWLSKGWIDYFAPQLYWGIESHEQSFPVLLKWWTQQNPKGRVLAPGLDDSKTSSRRRGPEAVLWQPAELVKQIQLTRRQGGASGEIHWNLGTLLRNDALAEALAHECYAEAALPPVYPWIDSKAPAKPTLTVVHQNKDDGGVKANWSPAASEKAALWVLQTKTSEWKTQILPGAKGSIEWHGSPPEVIAVTAVDRNGNCSPIAVAKLKTEH